MRKFYSILLLIPFLSPSLRAQITIGQAEMPDVGDQVARVQAAPNPLLNFGATGPAYTWNFGNLSAIGNDNTAYQSVASTNFVYAIAYANLPFNPNRANQAKPGVDIPFSNLLPINNPYTFRYKSSSVYKTVGFGAEVGGIPLPIIFSEHDVIYELPLQYGGISSSHSAYAIDIPTVGSYSFQQDRTNQVDGWGAITTPAGTFDVLRVKTTLNATDDLMGVVINRPVAREYKWLAQGLRTPVLQINTTTLFGAEVVSGVWYYDVPRSIEVVQPLANVLCPGSGLNVHYEVTGAFNAGGIIIPANQFRAQLSDAGGSFANPVVIGSVQSTGGGVIAATIPANTPEGTGYRIRVVSTSPSFTGSANTFDITIGGAPDAGISASGPAQICTGDTVILTAVGGPGYQWQLDGGDIVGATGDTFAASAAGSYTVSVSNACGTALSNAIEVVVNDPPVFTLDLDDLVSCADAPATLAATSGTGQQGLTFQWFLNEAPIAGATGTSVEANLSGQYTMEAANPATGCSFLTDGVMVTVESVDAPVLAASDTTTFCAGGSVELVVDEVAGLGYHWTMDGEEIAGANGTSLIVTNTGSYGVFATSTNGCVSVAATISVTVLGLPDAPTVTAEGPVTFCEGGEVWIGTAETAEVFQWLLDGQVITGADSSSLAADAAGSYTLLVTDANGCTSLPSAPVVVTVGAYPPVSAVSADGETSFCDGGEVVLSADAVDGASYQWWVDGVAIDGATGMTYTATTGGNYSVVLANAPGCETPGDTLAVTVHPTPAQPVISQHGDSLLASGSGTFQWFLGGEPIPGATSYWWAPVEDGNYTVQVTDGNGCTSTSEAWLHLTTGIGTPSAAGLRAWPNPGQGTFMVELPVGGTHAFDVVDITGQTVLAGTLSSARATLDLGTASDGIYFLRFPGTDLPVIRLVVAR